jgi:SCP-2 sterol transfer family protein
VARFLSEAWFEAVMASTDSAGYDETDETDETDDTDESSLHLQQVVTGTPDGEVRYGVRLARGRAIVIRGPVKDADVTFTEDYPTAAAIARGELSAQAALLAGRMRVSGNLATLATLATLPTLVRPGSPIHDPIPAAVRTVTTY